MPVAARKARAVRVSRCVRDRLAAPVDAVVVGVHSRACHLRLGSGELLVLVPPAVPLSPNGVAVHPADPAWRRGDPVELGPDALAAAQVWEPRPRVRPLTPRALADGLRATRAVALAEGTAPSLLPLLWEGRDAWGAAGPAQRLCAAASRRDAASVARAAAALAGLGPGLTPSGDDFLAGFAAAWTLGAAGLGRDGAARRRVTAAVGSGARAGASPLGRAWLAHALRGELPEPMTCFAETLLGAGARALAPAARDVLAVGASSGTDWIVGFLLGGAAALEAPWS
jgi:hypothetical protein